MRPRPPVLLAGVAAAIGRLAAQAPDAYAANDMRMLSTTLSFVMNDYERGPAWRTEEIAAMSALLRRGESIAPAEIASRLGEALRASEEKASTLTMPALDERLDAVRGALIELQAWLEASPSPEAATLLADVWTELRASVHRRGR